MQLALQCRCAWASDRHSTSRDSRLRCGGCPTKLLLANPSLDRNRYTELFQWNEMEMDLLTGLIARQQILLKRPDLTKVLTLTVDPKSYWIYTNTPVDNARVAETFQQYGFEAGIDRLAASS